MNNKIFEKKHNKIHGEFIGKIASSFYYVYDDTIIDDIANEMELKKNIFSLGVVNKNGNPIGIIIRRELFDLFGKPYGRDVYKFKKVSDICKTVKIFDFETNIFSIANKLSDSLYLAENNYYLLRSSDNQFAGIFSTKDILIYLSEITTSDIELAKKLQLNIVKYDNEFENKHCEIFGTSRMAKGVGGDYYAIKKYNNHNWFLTVCDVTGKGVSASMVSVVISGMLEVYDFNNGIAKFILTLNNYISNTFQLEKYLTGMFIDYNEKTGRVKIFDMSHSLTFLIRKNKCFKIKAAENLAVGILPDIELKRSSIDLEDNDIVVILTDGITDQVNSKGEIFGEKKVKKIILENRKEKLKKIRNKLFEEIDNFREDYPQFDDMTMIIFKHKK